jgi:hypothetical protein
MNDLIKMTCVILQNNTTQGQIAVTITLKGAFHNLKTPSYCVANFIFSIPLCVGKHIILLLPSNTTLNLIALITGRRY